MGGVLLDTNVLSELVKPRPHAKVVRFVRGLDDPWLCSITFHELAFGAARAPDPKRRGALHAWIAGVKAEFAGRTIPVDDGLADASGQLRAQAAAQGRPTSVVDSVLAAAVQSRGLALATRNTRDFEPFALALVDPWHSRLA